jgi:hypothetical protein
MHPLDVIVPLAYLKRPAAASGGVPSLSKSENRQGAAQHTQLIHPRNQRDACAQVNDGFFATTLPSSQAYIGVPCMRAICGALRARVAYHERRPQQNFPASWAGYLERSWSAPAISPLILISHLSRAF